MLRHLTILLFLCLRFGVATLASPHYTYTAGCASAYRHFMSLQLAEGRQILNLEQKNDPNNLLATYLADYDDCLLLLINCNPADYEARSTAMSRRLSQLGSGSTQSPWYLFCLSGAYLHRAIVNIRFGEQYQAAFNFRKSYALLKENQRAFPSFEYNEVTAGLLEAVVGSLPGSYKWLAAVFGMKGNIASGTARLHHFVSTHNGSHPLYAETVLYHIYCKFYLLAAHADAWQQLASPQAADNLLYAYIKTNIALDYRKADDALATLQNLHKAQQFTTYPVFYYQQAMALYTRCDTACVPYFDRYLRHNKSDLFIKDTWQKKAIAYYLAGNMAMASYCKQQIARYGTTRIDADKQAQRFAQNTTWPNKSLLQARLLIEGGYPERAKTVLLSIDTNSMTAIADRAEYYFRLGRVHEEVGQQQGASAQLKTALAHYRQAVSIGNGRKEQFAARAMLHTGKIYEELGMHAEAVAAYNDCLEMPAHDFQNSIDQQAKSGLNRLEHAK